jgi:hypothetical protein
MLIKFKRVPMQPESPKAQINVNGINPKLFYIEQGTWTNVCACNIHSWHIWKLVYKQAFPFPNFWISKQLPSLPVAVQPA